MCLCLRFPTPRPSGSHGQPLTWHVVVGTMQVSQQVPLRCLWPYGAAALTKLPYIFTPLQSQHLLQDAKQSDRAQTIQISEKEFKYSHRRLY